MVDGRIPARAVIVIVQPQIMLRAGAVSDVVHVHRVDVLIGPILVVRDAAVVAEATPGVGTRPRASGGEEEVGDLEISTEVNEPL